MRKCAKRSISLLLALVMLLGMLSTTALAAEPSGIITAYLYYKVNGQVPVDRNNKVQYNDMSQGGYGPSGDNTPMLAVKINVSDLLRIAKEKNSPVEFGDPTGRYPEWYFRPVSASEADIDAYWAAVKSCMTEDSLAALAATGMGDDFVCYMLKRNATDSHGYYVHMDGILRVSTKDDTDVYVCELYGENEAYVGGLVTDSTKEASDDPTLEEVYDIYEAYFGMPDNTEWVRVSGGASATYTGSDGNRYRATVKQTNGNRASHKPHESSEISYEKKNDNYYLAKFELTREKLPYTITYTDGLNDRVAFKDEVYTGLYYGDATPAFVGDTPEDPRQKLIFAGWAPTVDSTVTGDVVYVAQWEEEKYTVTWLDDDGAELEVDEDVANGTRPVYNGDTPTKSGDLEYSYQFIGWTPAVTPVDGADQVYTAVYRPVLNTYTVIWEDEDGTELEVDEHAAYGTLPTYDNARRLGTTAELASAKKTDEYTYRFAGWTPEVDFVTGDITYTATYIQTKNTYMVTWIDYNGNVLDTDTVEYGAQPQYTETEPNRVPTAQYTYTFEGWKNTDGEDSTVYASDGDFPAVTGNVTYQAQYSNEERSYTVTLELYLDGALVDSEEVHGTDLTPYISADGGSTLLVSEHTATGTYVIKNAPNNKVYGIYDANGDRICDQIIVVEGVDVEKACYYYTVSYKGNGADDGVPDTEAYHLGDTVTVEDAPERDGFNFKGWNVKGTSTVLQPGETLTASIAKAYTLVAQWEQTVDVTVNVTINHRGGGGYDLQDTKDDVFLSLVSRVNSGSAYLETGDTLTLDETASNHSYDEDEKVTTYLAAGVTFTDMPGGTTEYTVVTSKPGYYTTVTPAQDEDGNWIIDVEMTYDPTSFDLEFTVVVDPDVPEQHIPVAAIVKVTFYHEGEWKLITQQLGGTPGVRVDIDPDSRSGSGSYPVWKYESTSGDPYGYRTKVTAFVYRDGTIVPVDQIVQDVQWSDGIYTATAEVTGGEKYGTLYGAYYSDDTEAQAGALNTVITAKSYKVTLLGNEGTFGTDETKVIPDLLKMPDISGSAYKPTYDKHTFDGYDWYVDTNGNGEYDADDVPAAGELAAGDKLEHDYVLVAVWKSHWTVRGDITVDATYKLGGETKTIEPEDRIESVTVLLQYAPAGSTAFTTKRTMSVTITYDGNMPGTGEYEFEDVPDDGGTWRIYVLNHNYNTTYQNEKDSDFGKETEDLESPSIAVDDDDNNVAVVNAKMAFEPKPFSLYYKVIADDIGASYRPEEVEVLVLYDATTESESPRLWPVISQMQDGEGGHTGRIVTVKEAADAAVDFEPVWINHSLGHLYDYAIKVENVDGKEPNGDVPYTIEYNGSAQYLASGGYENQTQLLIAALKPKSYPVKYYLEMGSTVELRAMQNDAPIQVSSHTWSFATALKDGDGWIDIPARSGWVFTGWVDENGSPVTSIGAGVQAETKLYATWEVDNWKDDPDGDSPTGGDGIPDKYQVRIVYTTDGHGTTAPLGEIVTIAGDVYTDVTIGGDSVEGSTATALSGYAYDGWAYVGSSDSDDNAAAELNVSNTKLTPTIKNADGGNVYTFKVSFAEDHWQDNPTGNDSPTGGDGIPDKYQSLVEFRSVNTRHGTVTGNVYQVTTFANNATTGTVTPVLDGVTVNALNGWAFDYWSKDHGTTKLDATQVVQPIVMSGGEVVRFYANFAIDEWSDNDTMGDSATGGDGIPDYRQVLVTYISAAAEKGTVTGTDAVQVFTLPNDKETMDVTPAKDDLTITSNDGYAFDYWSDLEGFWGAAGAKLTDEQPFETHEKVPGGAILTYVAYFGTDNWDKDGGSETGGDGIPDAEQILIRYVSNDPALGSVSSAVEVISLTEGEKQGPEDISSDKIAGSTATALSGSAFDFWYSSRSNVSFDASAGTVDPAIYGACGGDVYTLTAAFGADVVGAENGSDGVPDVYQKPVTFVVVNGDWNDATDADRTVYVTLTKNGKWDLNGSGKLTAPTVGNLPDEGYRAGGWDENPPAAVTGTDEETYTYRYNLVSGLSYTVNYLEKDSGAVLAPAKTQGDKAYGDTVTAESEKIAIVGYLYDSASVPTLTISTGENTLNLYYKKDDSATKTLSYVVKHLLDGEEQTSHTATYQETVWVNDPDEMTVVAGSLTAKIFSGYKYVRTENAPVGDTIENGTVVILHYKKQSTPPAPPAPPAASETGSVTLTKVDSADKSTTLANVVFDLYKADGTFEGTYTTGADGTVTVDNLPAGEHYWIEVRPAEGYMLDGSKHRFTVTGGKNAEISISNTRTPVPDAFSGDHYAYVIGYNDGLVHPAANITRAEVATIFFRLLDDATREKYMTKENSFSDVSQGMWFNTAVSTMAAMGIVTGYPDGNFHPNDNITRAEFAVIAARFDANGNTTGVSFDDIYGHWAQKEINLAYNNGWILGYEDGTFRPNQNIVRAEAMTLINRVLQRVPEHKDDLLENMVRWPDNADTTKWYYLAIQEATNSHDYNRKANGYEYWTELKKVRDWTALEQ